MRRFHSLLLTKITNLSSAFPSNNPWRTAAIRDQGWQFPTKKLFRGRRYRRNNGLFLRNSGSSAEQKTPLFYTTVLYPTYSEGKGALRTTVVLVSIPVIHRQKISILYQGTVSLRISSTAELIPSKESVPWNRVPTRMNVFSYSLSIVYNSIRILFPTFS